MPALSITIRKIKDVLRLKFEGKQPHQQIADALGLSKGVVTKYVGLAVAAGLDWPVVAAMDEAALERRLLEPPRSSDIYAQAGVFRSALSAYLNAVVEMHYLNSSHTCQSDIWLVDLDRTK